ncbi:MAG TPA: hypothetical protein VHT53_01475 [Candidatus Elarobacter sp.]|jgi:hypothetical protein|nr:hypothetical protein [Candidatus Elarobacter sp.]
MAKTAATANLWDPSLAIEPPATRPLRVYAFDPTLGRKVGNELVIDVRYEPLRPGPVGERFAVVDYDGSTGGYYVPVDLDDPAILLRRGLDPTEADPRFHQQMVYAVASETLNRFEVALGRRVHWRRPRSHRAGVPNRLYLFPHGILQANAFYSPDAHGILFGYFRAAESSDAQVLPGQTIFTCLSHDIVAHETTHAVVDGIRTYFTEATNIDVPAFHEAFADLSALFRHFSHSKALLDTLQKTGGLLFTEPAPSTPPSSGPALVQTQIPQDNPLIELARQFGQVAGLHNGLRSALGSPATADAIQTTTEPHLRGAILVAAVFDAYFTVYQQQTADLFSIFRAGGGPANPIDLPAPLAERLACAASSCAELFFSVCARALDYCPPVDVTFGDFLRAVLTADKDLYPSDTFGVRDAIMQAFRLRGIFPDDAEFFSEASLCWPQVNDRGLPPVTGLVFGDPNGLTRPEQNRNAATLRAYAAANAKALGFERDASIDVPSFHPMFRTDENGSLKIDMVVELVHTKVGAVDTGALGYGALPMRAGVTLMIAQQPIHAGRRADPVVRFAIPKHLSADRVARQRAMIASQGRPDVPHTVRRGGPDNAVNINFALLHGV